MIWPSIVLAQTYGSTTRGGRRPLQSQRGVSCRVTCGLLASRCIRLCRVARAAENQSSPVGQIQVAKFRSVDSLARAGTNLWAETGESGPPAVAPPGTGGRGHVTAGTIESSNVDLAEEMVSMIQHQRAFSASSKVIATADDMLSQLMQLKR